MRMGPHPHALYALRATAFGLAASAVDPCAEAAWCQLMRPHSDDLPIPCPDSFQRQFGTANLLLSASPESRTPSSDQFPLIPDRSRSQV